MLVGDAGSGKSVILKDLWQKLDADGTIVLGIKADEYYVDSLQQLKEKLDVEDTLEKMVQKLSIKNQEVVILIDQIDALSQALSTNRNYLNTYRLLVKKLSSIKGVKVILSVRNWDLKYDSGLNFFDRNQKKKILNSQKVIHVKDLGEQHVNAILKQLSVNNKDISRKLFELLRKPLHLDVFSKIYKQSDKLESIQTLQDLYDELWKQKILSLPKQTPAKQKKCVQLLYEIVTNIEITTSIKPFENKYLKELKYLKSIQIIIGKEKKIQFFHQTFFDFIFAKKFIEDNLSITKLLKDHEQGLLVRAKLKMILGYLREQNPKKYLKTLKKLLQKTKVRFHIKHLLLTLLGYQDNPTKQEKEFVKSSILKHKSYKRIFLELAWGKGWLAFLIKNSILNELLSHNKTEIKTDTNHLVKLKQSQQLWLHLLARKLPEERILVLNYIKKAPEFEDKAQKVSLILFNLKVWDNTIAKELFSEYSDSIERDDNFGYYKILEDASKYDFEWAVNIYRKKIHKKLSLVTNKPREEFPFSYEEKQLMKKLFLANSAKAFDFYLEIIKSVIEKTKQVRQAENKDSFYIDYAFLMYSYKNSLRGNDYQLIYTKLVSEIKKLAIEDSDKFEEIRAKLALNNSETLLVLLIHGYIANPKKNIQHIFDFFEIFKQKKGFHYERNLLFYARKLLNVSYNFFSNTQKKIINEFLLKGFKFEPYIYKDETGKKKMSKDFGFPQLKFLEALPKEAIVDSSTIKAKYLELKRKFGNIEDKEPNRITTSWGSPNVLSKEASEKMTLKQWEKSFEKFGVNLDLNSLSDNWPIIEHARVFKEQVKKRPTEFFPFLGKLVHEPKFAFDFTVHGLEGLKEGKYQISSFLKLFEEVIKIDFSSKYTMYLVWLTKYFIEEKEISKPVVIFLINTALTHPNPENDDIPSNETVNYVQNPLSYGINTARGAAAEILSCLFFKKEFEREIFDALFKIAEDWSLKVRVCLLPRLEYMRFLNEEKTLQLFLILTQSNEEALLKHALRPAHYLSHYNFEKLIPFFNKASKFGTLTPDIATLLVFAWYEGEKKSFEMLKTTLHNNEEARHKMPRIAINNLYLKSGKVNKKSLELFQWFFKDKSEAAQNGYSMAFHDLKVSDFKIMYPLIKKYAKSIAGKRNLSEYFNYLEKCTSKYPKECIKLMDYFNDYSINTPKQQRSGYYKDEPVKVVMAAYNQLDSTIKEERKYIKIAMKIFDKMLLSQVLRDKAYKVLDDLN